MGQSKYGFVDAMIIGPQKAREAARRGEPGKVFDWDRAARRIREVRPQEAAAGLADDWNYTGGSIYRDGEPVPSDQTYTYLASIWATPELELDGVVEDCYITEPEAKERGWDHATYWPDSALAILRGA